MYHIFHNTKRKKKEPNCLILLDATYLGDSVSSLFHCIHSYFTELSCANSFQQEKMLSIQKTIKTMTSLCNAMKNATDNCKVVPKNPSMAKNVD